MIITTVKLQENGYLVNETMSVPEAEGNRHYQMVQEWIAQGNTPEPEFTDAEKLQQTKSEKIAALKEELFISLSVGFTCSNDIKMDAFIENVAMLKHAYDLHIMLSEEPLSVTDFNNVEHSLMFTEVDQMLQELGVNFRNLRKVFIDKRLAVNAITIDTTLDTALLAIEAI